MAALTRMNSRVAFRRCHTKCVPSGNAAQTLASRVRAANETRNTAVAMRNTPAPGVCRRYNDVAITRISNTVGT
jgi:hypothetical protein